MMKKITFVTVFRKLAGIEVNMHKLRALIKYLVGVKRLKILYLQRCSMIHSQKKAGSSQFCSLYTKHRKGNLPGI